MNLRLIFKVSLAIIIIGLFASCKTENKYLGKSDLPVVANEFHECFSQYAEIFRHQMPLHDNRIVVYNNLYLDGQKGYLMDYYFLRQSQRVARLRINLFVLDPKFGSISDYINNSYHNGTLSKCDARFNCGNCYLSKILPWDNPKTTPPPFLIFYHDDIAIFVGLGVNSWDLADEIIQKSCECISQSIKKAE